jgi:predicted DNA-binding transcriptional regulator YafY
VVLDRRWYLVAYDLDRQDWRTFRLDRVTAAGSPAAQPFEPASGRFRPREIPGGDAARFVRRTIATSPGSYEVAVIFEAPAATIRERIGRWATLEDIGPGRCRARMTPPGNADWAVIALGMAAEDFTVVSPAELAGRVRDWGERFTRATNVAVRAAPASGGEAEPAPDTTASPG